MNNLASGGTELPSREQPCSASEHVRNQCGKHVEESIGSRPVWAAWLWLGFRMVTRNGEDSPDAARHDPFRAFMTECDSAEQSDGNGMRAQTTFPATPRHPGWTAPLSR